MKTIEDHIKIAMKDCSLTERQENALLNGIEAYLSELEEVNKITSKQPVICCGILEKMTIAWMRFSDGTKVAPFIAGEDGEKYRVNHCPSCGAYVRDAKIEVEP